MGALLNMKGTLYGMTGEGGTENNGTVFAINNGVETIIRDFNGSQGEAPVVALSSSTASFTAQRLWAALRLPAAAAAASFLASRHRATSKFFTTSPEGKTEPSPPQPRSRLETRSMALPRRVDPPIWASLYKVALRTNKETVLV